MLTPHVHEIRHQGCSPYAPLAAPRCGGGELIVEKASHHDYRDPACKWREWECPGCVDCLRDRDPVECAQCAWNDGGQLVVEDTPVGRRVTGFEGTPRGFCAQCDECFDHGHGVRHDNTRRRFA